MNLHKKIKTILSNEKFKNLSDEKKAIVEDCIFSHCLILSQKNQERYLKTIEESVINIEDLGNGLFHANGNCYDGIVRTILNNDPKKTIKAIRLLKLEKSNNKLLSLLTKNKNDEAKIPLKYSVYIKEFDKPFNRITNSMLHELGHIVVKNQQIDSSNSIVDKGILKMSFGGLMINHGFKESYGSLMQEVTNELTTFLAFKSYLAYPQYEDNEKIKSIGNIINMNLSFDDRKTYLEILPDNLFLSYPETELANDKNFEMFNPVYVRYTPLVKLIMHSFQNPRFSTLDLKNEFVNGNGLSATKDGEPINDFFYGYYESSFRPAEIFDSLMSSEINWETLCKEFDKEIYNNYLNTKLIDNYISIFQDFYEKRNTQFLKLGKITQEQYNQNMATFNKTVEVCNNYYRTKKID